jgi:hypothetical protein
MLLTVRCFALSGSAGRAKSNGFGGSDELQEKNCSIRSLFQIVA